jgi:glycine cleavage system pyridoxal-binding protein P
VADDVLPQTLEVVRTRALPLGIEVKVGPPPTPRRPMRSACCCSTRA